jgi:hypothetical protein
MTELHTKWMGGKETVTKEPEPTHADRNVETTRQEMVENLVIDSYRAKQYRDEFEQVKQRRREYGGYPGLAWLFIVVAVIIAWLSN